MFSKITQSLLPVLLLAVTVFTNAQTKPTSASVRMSSLDQLAAMEKVSPLANIRFRNIGPSVMSGRAVDIDANPDDPTEFYVAYASGGLWYTVNNGLSFVPVFDSATVISIGDIAVRWRKNPGGQSNNIIWLGTGEVNSSRSSYAGTGVFRSDDNGRSWQYLGLPESHHIGKIQLHPTNDNIAWVAVLGHLYSANKERGVYLTTDGGKTWNQSLYIDDNTGAIDLDINPKNPDEVYAAMWYRTRRAWSFEESGATSGIYKSTDGGKNWQLLSKPNSGFLTGSRTGRIGLAVAPQNPQIIYAVVDNQTPRPDTSRKDTAAYNLDELKNLSIEAFAQLNEKRLDSFLRRSRVPARYSTAVLKDMVANNRLKPTALYDYLYVNTGFESTPTGAEVYKSEDAGNTWKKMNEKEIPIYFTYGYYFGKIYVSPNNSNRLYALGFSSQISNDGGRNWKNMDKNNVHADHHALWIDPKKDGHLINGNDGGVNITYDNGDVWFKANMPPVGQFYGIAVDNAKPYNVYGGLQDNGVWYLPSQTGRNSFSNSGLGLVDDNVKNLGGGDGMQVQVDQRDNATVFYGSQFGNYSRSNRMSREGSRRVTPRHEMGEKPLRFNWQTPILLSPHNADIFYIGSERLYRSFNSGDSLIAISGDLTLGGKPGNVPFGTLTTLTESPLRFGVLYTGSDDGAIQFSKDGGANWILVNPASKKAMPAGLWVSRVIASKYREPRVYASLNGYRNDDFMPYLYVSEDYGTTWKQIGKNLPAEPINVVREDPKNEQILYVGTDGGLYVSFDRGGSFVRWTAGLPRSVPIHDIAIQERENEIVLGTHGRSIYIAKLDEVQKKR